MSEFRVWAPDATRVELSLIDGAHAMNRVERGWWELDLPSLPPETDYAYLVDGQGPFPDPRSPWQPNGVHAASRTLDHGSFRWQHDTWPDTPLRESVIYELHTGTFTSAGTFDAAIERLEHLTDLGVTHIELMPVASFSGDRGWGYDGVDLYAPHEPYGGPAGLKRLVDAAHGKGLRVMLDVVYNHLGPSGNYLEQFGPYFTPRYHTPWGKAINYDQADSDEVRRYVVDNALMWLRDYRFDGLRLDAVHAILDQSAVHILEQLATEVHRLSRQTGRRYDVIAESDLNDPRLVRDVELGGYGLDGAWSDDFHHALHAVLSGEGADYYQDFGRLSDLARALSNVYVNDGRYSPYRRRSHGRPVGDLPASRFVVAAQNHDQVGNRARGERLEHLVGPRLAQIAAAILLLGPNVPLLFQGEEWAASSPFQYFTAHEDPELGRAVSEGRRREFEAFGWQPDDVPDPQAEETFRRSLLDWDEIALDEHAAMIDWYRQLIALRRSMPHPTDGRLDNVIVVHNEDECWLTMSRGEITLAVNLSAENRVIQLSEPRKVILTNVEGAELEGTRLSLPSQSVAVVRESAA
jgi:maltooligosyltrehalose trehalohydrolase